MRRKLLTCFLVLSAVLFSTISTAQTTVTGKIMSSETQSPLQGVSVKVSGTNVGSMTNANGEFSISAPAGSKTIELSFVGFKTQTVQIGTAPIIVNLQPAASELSEVVVTAGGIVRKKRELGTAQTSISAATLVQGKAVNIAGGLIAKAAGLQIQGTTGGVNPNYRIILRGNRSLTGNNEALIVLDNVIVPNEVLGNLNPDDVESLNILQGAGAAALYGSKASNGAIIVTTKKGKSGRTSVRFAQTETIEHVAYFPKMQSSYGQGGSSYGYDTNGQPVFSSIENQSYGPHFDGSTVPLGVPLEDGTQGTTKYTGNDTRRDFWQQGLTSQSDFSLSSGDAVSTLYVSGQYANVTGTTPKDEFNRASLRVNGSRKIKEGKLNSSYSLGFTQNNYNITTQTHDIYNNMLNMPSNIDITRYANWKTDPLSNPNGYYNPWYLNPYWELDNYRQTVRNTYLVGNVQLTFTPTKWLDITVRQGMTHEAQYNKNWNNSFSYTEFAKASSSNSKSDISAAVSDGVNTSTNMLSDLFFQVHAKKDDFTFNLLGGGQWNQDEYKGVGVSASPLVVPDLYNVGNLVGIPGASESSYKARTMGVYGEFRVSYKDYLYLHVTGRNDWTSILPPNNRSFFYPSADLSFLASSAIEGLRNSNTISYLKLRAGVAKVGEVNLPGTYGAYQLQRTFSQQSGFPYGSLPGFGLDNRIVSDDLKPELTKQYEFGFDLNLFKDRLTSSVTWYHSTTSNQTVSTGISYASGGSSYLTNVGETMSQGLEADLHGTVVRNSNWQVKIGGNVTFLDNKVISINGDLINQIALSSYGDGSGSYAKAGYAFPVIMGFDFVRDTLGRVIVDRNTGLPAKDPNLKVLGNAVAKVRLGLDFDIRYKNFNLTGLFEYRGGYDMYFGSGSDYDWAGTGIQTTIFNRGRFVFPNSVYEDPSKPGAYIKNTNITITDGNGNAGYWTDNLNRTVSANYVSSGAFWKLREMSLSYDLTSSLVKKPGFIKSAEISVQGRNLFIWLPKTNLYTDPEYSEVSATSNGVGITGISSAPPSRYYGATFAITF
jgi:TonB-linked SusC/RagA family outer membrane protein